MRTLLGLHGLSLLALQCSAFLGVLGVSKGPLFNNLLSLMMSAKDFPHLHLAEYPDDDYSHTLGFGDPQHKLSQLQKISALCIAETTRNKIPIDTVSRWDYVSWDLRCCSTFLPLRCPSVLLSFCPSLHITTTSNPHSQPPHLHTSAPPYLRTSIPPHPTPPYTLTPT
jgi:hypothetical protein